MVGGGGDLAGIGAEGAVGCWADLGGVVGVSVCPSDWCWYVPHVHILVDMSLWFFWDPVVAT